MTLFFFCIKIERKFKEDCLKSVGEAKFKLKSLFSIVVLSQSRMKHIMWLEFERSYIKN